MPALVWGPTLFALCRKGSVKDESRNYVARTHYIVPNQFSVHIIVTWCKGIMKEQMLCRKVLHAWTVKQSCWSESKVWVFCCSSTWFHRAGSWTDISYFINGQNQDRTVIFFFSYLLGMEILSASLCCRRCQALFIAFLPSLHVHVCSLKLWLCSYNTYV